jgi:hypothetical protein
VAVNLQPTVSTIRQIADQLRDAAATIDRYATQMEQKQDIEVACDVLNEVRNLQTRLRLDLLLTRPMRAMRAELEKNSD